MKVYQTIIHEIDKEHGVLEAHLSISEHVRTEDETFETLVDNLNKVFNRSTNIVRTEFIDLEVHNFKNQVDIVLANINDNTFYDFSKNTIGHLRSIIEIVSFAKGGYYVYTHYENLGRNYLAIFIVRDADKMVFKRNPQDTDFIVDTTTIVDTDNLAMAVRIDIDRYQGGELRFLQFTNYKQKEVSEYFIKWIEASLADRSKADTKSFIQIMADVDLPIDPDTEKVYDEDKFRKSVYKLISASGGIVRLSELGKTFWYDENYLLDYISRKNIHINTDFRATDSILKRLSKYEISSGHIKLTFVQSDWKRGIISRGGKDQIIIESDELRNQIEELFGNE